MIDFYDHDHECPCEHNGHLEAAQRYSAIISKLEDEIAKSKTTTEEEQEKWDSKADKSYVDELKTMVEKHEERLDDLEDGLDKKVSLILKELGIDENVLSKYATIQYVNDLVASAGSSADLSKYALKTDLESVRLELTNRINNISGSIIDGKDYSITGMAYSDDYLTLTQTNGGTFRVKITSSGSSDDGITEDDLIDALTGYVKKTDVHKIIVNGTSLDILSQDITITTSGSGGTGEDGGTYVPYFMTYTSGTTLPQSLWPTAGQDPTKKGWIKNIASTPSAGQYVWMTQVLIKAGSYVEYTTPFCITGPQGEAGVDTNGKEFIYKLEKEGVTPTNPNASSTYPWGTSDFGAWKDTPQGVSEEYPVEWLLFRTKDANDNVSDWYPQTASGDPKPIIWSHYGHNGTDGDGVEYIFASLKPGETYSSVFTGDYNPTTWTYDTSFQTSEYIKESAKDRWDDDPIDISTEAGYGSGSKTYVSLRRRSGSNGSSEDSDAKWGAYSKPALWSYMPIDGSGEQYLLGSPLRNRGEWSSTETYYDGYSQASDNDKIFWQDFVTRKHTVTVDGVSKEVIDRYVCIKMNSGNTPENNTTYWNQLTDVGPIYTDILVATKAYVDELTTKELIIQDGDTVVAGMTSGSQEDGSTQTTQGDVRIWAGNNGNNIAKAPFTVTDQGVVTSRGSEAVIQINNGVIYFTTNNTKWWLGIGDDGKPNWLGGNGSADEMITYYTLTKNGNYVTSAAVSQQLGVKDSKYYTNGTLRNLFSGTVYFKLPYTDSVYDCTSYTVLVGPSVAGVEWYKKVSIVNGVATNLGVVAIAKGVSPATSAVSGSITLNVGTYKQWCTITKKTPTTYIVANGIVSNSQTTGDVISSSNVTADSTVYMLKTTTSESVNSDLEYSHWLDVSSSSDQTYTILTVSA